MGNEPVQMWPYLSQFETHMTDFAHLNVFNDALLGYGIRIENSKNRFL